MLNRLDPKQVAVATAADLDIEPGSSAVGLLVGGRYPVETLWLGLLLQSGNDAANMLARLGAGSARAGVDQMNAEARRLGALQTPRRDAVRPGRPRAVHQRVRPGADRPRLLRRPPLRAGTR